MSETTEDRPEPTGLASRRTAWRAVRRVHEHGSWSVPAVNRELSRGDLDARDRAFAANLAYETLRWEGTLDWALAKVVSRPLADVDPPLLDILRIGAWQLLYGGVPDRAAVGTAVDLARAELGAKVTGFVNGALRALARRLPTLPWPSTSSADGLGLVTGYPTWVAAAAQDRFGARAQAVLEAGNAAPGVTLRAHVGIGADALIAELRDLGLEAEPSRHAPESVRAPGGDPSRLDAVSAGRATPQDEASTLVGRVVLAGLDDPTTAVVADLASAPGGKATHLAESGATVVAMDLRPARVALVREQADRLGLDRLHVVCGDAARPPLAVERFDAVLLDAPCTGLGVVRRRPEIRWRRSAEDAVRLGRLQLELLTAAAQLVRPGGWLVYSVCTWTREETVEVALSFDAVEGDRFVVADPSPALGGAGRPEQGHPSVLLSPDVDHTDGMYVSCWRRAR